ncbi:glutamate--tRNA ligase [Candidatus Woesearchaeota archaeon]|nr:glutamate--tRNA ligase [Candidatus Woesearchaeota archaeon]
MSVENVLKRIAEKHALINAAKHGYKASIGAVISKVVSEMPESKKQIQLVKQVVQEVVELVNNLSPGEIEQRLESLGLKQSLKSRPREKTFEELLLEVFKPFKTLVQGSVVTAFPPEPSKYPHIGHAKALLLNYYFAKIMNGSFILRFEDTNPLNVKQEYYDAMFEMLEWLGVKPDKITYASDLVKELQELAEELIRKGYAYVCSCSKEEIKISRDKGIACKHRSQSVEQNLELWKQLLDGKEGLILRAKIDLQHKNTAMRDPTLFRVINKEHLRVKNVKAWPSYDFQNAMLDALQGVNIRFRSKEFELRGELHNYLQKIAGFKPTSFVHFARFNIEGALTSGRLIRELIQKHEIKGWDDPRLVTIKALKKRGFLPEAVKYFLISTGVSKSESSLKMEALEAVNRRFVDKIAKRYFLIVNPVKIRVKNAPVRVVKLKLHPEKDLGFRVLHVNDSFLIERKDFEKLKPGRIHRLMECLNFEVKNNELQYHSDDYNEYRKNPGLIMHWLPNNEAEIVKARVLMPNGEEIQALTEANVLKEKPDSKIQAERFGFLRIESIDEDQRIVSLVYTHR